MLKVDVIGLAIITLTNLLATVIGVIDWLINEIAESDAY